MAKRKVVKFVYQGYRKVKKGEWFGGELFKLWDSHIESTYYQHVYHKSETEEEVPGWRAQVGESYYSVTADLQSVKLHDTLNTMDNCLYDAGNYFGTEDEAQKYLEHCKKFFENI